MNQALRRELGEKLDLAAERGEVETTTSLTDGDPAAVLEAESGELDLLVLGSRGYGPLRSVILGSVSAAAVEGAACPIVVTPRVDSAMADE